MKNVKINSFSEKIRKLREDQRLPLRKVAAFLDIDQAILSKIERGIRKPNRKNVVGLAKFYKVDEYELLVDWLSDRIVYEIKNEANANWILKVAEQKVAYSKPVIRNNSYMIDKFGSVFEECSAINKAWLFGSFSRGENTASSDVDILIDVPNEETFTLFDLAEIREKLFQITGRKVDVVLERALEPGIKKRIKPDLKLIYEA
jgi:predicted nucleotidyltransferase